MISVVGFKDDHLVARVEQGQAGAVKGPRRAGGGDNLRLRIDDHPGKALLLGRDRLAQLDQPGEVGVYVYPRLHRLLGAAPDRQRHPCIADPLRKVYPASPVAFNCHIPYFRLHDPRMPVAYR